MSMTNKIRYDVNTLNQLSLLSYSDDLFFCYCFCPVAVVHYMYDLTAKHIYLFLKYYKDNLDQIWYIASVGKRIQIVNCITHPP